MLRLGLKRRYSVELLRSAFLPHDGQQRVECLVDGPLCGTHLNSRSWPASRPPRDEAVARASELDFRLFGHFKGVVHLDAEVADGTLQFGMAEQQLNGAEVLGPPVD